MYCRKKFKSWKFFSKYINESCSKLDSDFGIDCEHILREINVELDDMKSIKSIINAQCQRSSRKKRQLNFIGHIFKEITGIMDSDDSKRLDDDLTKIRDNEQQLMQQLHKQTIAIDSIFGVANQTIYNVQAKLLNFSHAIDTLNKQKAEQGSKNLAMTHLNELLGEMNLVLAHVIRRKNLVLSLMKTGEMELSPDLLNPTTFLSELNKAKKLLSNGLDFAVEVNYKNIMKFYKFSKIVTELYNCELNINITTPLYTGLNFEAYKGTSVPMFRDNKLFIVALENDVLLVAKENSAVTTLKYEDYKKCNSIQDIKLCSFIHTYEHINFSRNCLVDIFANKTENSCNFQPLNLEHQLWIQMANKNSWIYALPNKTTIHIFLGSKVTTTMELSGIGMLKLIKLCMVKTGETFFQYFPSDSLEFEFTKIKIDFPNTPNKVKLIDEKIPDTIADSIISEFNGKTLFNEIVNLKAMNAGKVQLMDIELEKHSFSFWKMILILLLIAGLTWMVVKLYKFLKLKFGGKGTL